MLLPTKPGWKTGVAIGCDHSPFINHKVYEERCRIIREANPDVVIHLGDVFDAEAGADKYGRFFNASEAKLHEEYAAASELLSGYRGAAPNARYYWLEGNHEARVRTADRIPKSLLGIVDYRKVGELGKEWKNWEWRPYISPDRHLPDAQQGIFRFGQVSVIHGFEFGANSDKNEAQLYAAEYGLLIRAHTHKPQPPTRAMMTTSIPTNRWFANVGFGGDMEHFKLGYASRRNTTMWGPAAVVFTYNPKITNAGDKHWSAITIEL